MQLNLSGQSLNDTIIANFYNEVVKWALLSPEGLSKPDSSIIDILHNENKYYGNIFINAKTDTSLLQKKSEIIQ